MHIRTSKKALGVALAVALLAGCASTPEEESQSTQTGGTETTQTTTPTTTDTTPSSTQKEAPQVVDSVVYFDFDKATLRSQTRAVLNVYAERLKTDGGTIVLEGHADERGTREYNLALGERRAKAVASYLMVQGVSSSQIDTVSYGEEKPVSMGHDEQSWQQNRRVVLK